MRIGDTSVSSGHVPDQGKDEKKRLAEDRHASAKLHKSWGSSPAAHGTVIDKALDRPASSRGSRFFSHHHRLSSSHSHHPISPQPAAIPPSKPFPQSLKFSNPQTTCSSTQRRLLSSVKPLHATPHDNENRSILGRRFARPARDLPNPGRVSLLRLNSLPRSSLSRHSLFSTSTQQIAASTEATCAVLSPPANDQSVEEVQGISPPMATAGLTGGGGNATDLLRQTMIHK